MRSGLYLSDCAWRRHRAMPLSPPRSSWTWKSVRCAMRTLPARRLAACAAPECGDEDDDDGDAHPPSKRAVIRPVRPRPLVLRNSLRLVTRISSLSDRKSIVAFVDFRHDVLEVQHDGPADRVRGKPVELERRLSRPQVERRVEATERLALHDLATRVDERNDRALDVRGADVVRDPADR